MASRFKLTDLANCAVSKHVPFIAGKARVRRPRDRISTVGRAELVIPPYPWIATNS